MTEPTLTPEDGGYVITDPDTGVTTQGDTEEEARENRREALEVWRICFCSSIEVA